MAGGPVPKSDSFDYRELLALDCFGWFWGNDCCDSTWGVVAVVDFIIRSQLLEFEGESTRVWRPIWEVLNQIGKDTIVWFSDDFVFKNPEWKGNSISLNIMCLEIYILPVELKHLYLYVEGCIPRTHT